MEHVSFIRKRTVWFLLLAVFVSTGFLRAQDGGALSKQELKLLIVSAKTAQDHERLAKHFDAEADQLGAEANDHQAMVAVRRQNSIRPRNHNVLTVKSELVPETRVMS
jgi:hypothetical protein